MNSAAAIRYNNAERLAFISGPHLSHQPEVAAYLAFLYIASMRRVTDINAGKDQRDEAEAPRRGNERLDRPYA